jgi:lysozyme
VIPTPFKASPRAVALIASFEDFAATAYTCPAGKLTIGYGHVILKREPHLTRANLTKAQAEALLAADIGLVETYLNAVLPDWIQQHHFDALVSLVFNIGIGNFDSSTLRKLLKAGQRNQAAGEFTKWVYSKGVRLWGLHIRRNCERLMYLGITDAGIANERARLQTLTVRDW